MSIPIPSIIIVDAQGADVTIDCSGVASPSLNPPDPNVQTQRNQANLAMQAIAAQKATQLAQVKASAVGNQGLTALLQYLGIQ